MNVRTSLLPMGDCPTPIGGPAITVVIDVLRATSVMTAAIDAGAARIITASSVDSARRLADRYQARLGGERDCVKLDGFDFGNSPVDYLQTSENRSIRDQAVVLTTTNGTTAIRWALNGSAAGNGANAAGSFTLIAGSIANYSAVLRRVTQYRSLHLVCSGTDGFVSGEDVLLAGAWIAGLVEALPSRPELDDASEIALAAYRSRFGMKTLDRVPNGLVSSALRTCLGGRNLIDKQMGDDIDWCAAVDRCDAVATLIQSEPPTFAVDDDA